MIEITHLTKRYGDKTAVADLSFTVRPGIVTGFLGPNGAGKSTTMRLILGLDAPDAGAVTINGAAYARLKAPLREVGALLEARAVHPGRSARNHLRGLAATTGIPVRRVDELLDLVGLSDVARRRTRGFSLGMWQRLGIATALLGDPHTLILDEPVNGLDPEGIRWIRDLLRSLATQGRTILVSSHLMSEMAVTADHVVIIGRGRLIADRPVADVVAATAGQTVKVRTPEAARLAAVLAADGVTVTEVATDELTVAGLSSADIGLAAADRQIPLFELTPVQPSLEDVFMNLTRDSLEYGVSTGGQAT